MGNTIAAKSPAFRGEPFMEKNSDTNDTVSGPTKHPASPARASSANMAVPPAGQLAAAMDKVPGHMMPTATPQIPQPMRLTMALVGMDVTR